MAVNVDAAPESAMSEKCSGPSPKLFSIERIWSLIAVVSMAPVRLNSLPASTNLISLDTSLESPHMSASSAPLAWMVGTEGSSFHLR